VPGAVVLANRVPKHYVSYELYNGLQYNTDEKFNYYLMNPRVDSFEVSYKGYVSLVPYLLTRISVQLIFSKLGANYWPNIKLVANKAAMVAWHEMHENCDFSGFLAGMHLYKNGEISPSRPKPVRQIR